MVEGTAQRGGASCDLGARVLRVPWGEDEVSRVVRAHELAHIRVSPHLAIAVSDVSPRALECAEEFRVNTLLARLGFDTSLLCDGSERTGGRRLAEAGSWAEAVAFFLAVAGTGAEGEYLKGVRAAQPSWASALRSLGKKLRALVEPLATSDVAGTDVVDGLPRGFSMVSVPAARLVTRFAGAAAPRDALEVRGLTRSLEPGSRRPPSQRFAELVWDDGLDMVRRTPGSGHRRSAPSMVGVDLRYPSRLLTDPMSRGFAQRRRAEGGVIVIDQSGSMDVGVEDIDLLLRRSPGAVIVGYSHRPGDVGAIANAWVLARNGLVASRARAGNVGNGVDGPALRWALRHAKGGPVVWVTDGQVTDSNDHACHSLSVECAQLVRRHRIRMARDLTEAHLALRGRRFAAQRFGRVGQALSE